jgi:ABC-type phosphate/phosphonate transport system substrate-binding protein
MKRPPFFPLAAFLMAFSSAAIAAKDTIVFSTAPTEKSGDLRVFYQPLLDLVAKASGKRVVMEPAENYVEYTNRMRQGAYDMVFDGPHFVSWRMERLGHVPLVRLPGKIQIVVAVRDEDGVRSLDELAAGRPVCTFPSPNMLAMIFLSHFPNPARQPELVTVKGLPALAACLREGRGEAAVLRQEPWDKLDQTGLRALAVPAHGYPERTISISADIEPEIRAKIAEALVSEEGTKATERLLKAFKHERFVPADPKEYEGMVNLLAPLWGFQ